MAKRKTPRKPNLPTPNGIPHPTNTGRRELIFVSRPSVGLRSVSGAIDHSLVAAAMPDVAEILSTSGARIEPLFIMPSAPSIAVAGTDRFGQANELAEFFHVAAPDEKLDELAAALRRQASVEAVFIKPPGEPPMAEPLNMQQPKPEEPPATPDLSSRQVYLNAAPAGVDARYAWRFPGGRGSGVQIIDCEWGWRLTHEDLQHNKGSVVVGTASPDDNHGTAVLGEFGADLNPFGVTGICSEAFVRFAAFTADPTARVIQQAADKLRPGDILLLEIHRSGPGASGVGQDGYIAIEWWPDDLAAIRYAAARGVIVVEAGGNGARNLDDPLYDQPAAGFPATWRNPFNPANSGSGAIVVGAGAPPPGTHGHDWGADRSRLDFSNFGRCIDAQGWGREVTSTGYGDLQGGAHPEVWYTDQFSGTSSASPIVVGVLGSVQGILRARHRPLLTPQTARNLLRRTGSPQQDGPNGPRTERIGNRPDIRAMLGALLGPLPVDADGEQGAIQSTGVVQGGGIVINIRGAGVTVNISGD